MTGQNVIPAGKGSKIFSARGSVMAFKAVADQTSGDFSLMERTLPPGGRRPLPHRHVAASEAFFVLDGTVTFVVDGTEMRGGSNDFLLVPRGAAHTFGNGGDEPARLLVLHAPAMDAYFAELDELWSRPDPPTQEQERALMSRHGMEPALRSRRYGEGVTENRRCRRLRRRSGPGSCRGAGRRRSATRQGRCSRWPGWSSPARPPGASPAAPRR
jgi:mannose-6-phosphate isomerase-like protein (cupin superfamily)